ncbi:S1 family peptidase [Hyphococcus sp.]|uniref:S1 family peptidase n=1 Tax=Hyphococcus sp. TaxID=2038636 RepID=UPI003CCB7A80
MIKSPSDDLIHSTVLISTKNSQGQCGSGTGFLVQWPLDDEKQYCLLITNRHVVKDAEQVQFEVIGTRYEDGVPYPDLSKVYNYNLNTAKDTWWFHPNEDIDLAAFPFGKVINSIVAEGETPYVRVLASDLIPNDQQFGELDAVESVAMIGYPIGLMDRKNRLPVFRTGVTATPVYHDYNGKNEFLIDCACFPGSSGSPVFLYNQGSYFDKTKSKFLFASLRVRLLGVLYAGPQLALNGEIHVEPIPMTRIITKTNIMINLGNCIRADALKDLAEYAMSTDNTV